MVDQLALLASTQFGLITFDQAIAAGFSKAALNRRLGSGGWTKVQPGVYALPGSVDSWERSLKAVQLRVPDAIVSHRAAAAMWELDGVTDRLVELTRNTKAGPSAASRGDFPFNRLPAEQTCDGTKRLQAHNCDADSSRLRSGSARGGCRVGA